MHRAERYCDRIAIERNRVTRIVTAFYGGESVDVLKENEDGGVLCRNLNFIQIGGYFVDMPNDEYADRYGAKRKYGKERWRKPCLNVNPSIFSSPLAPSEEEKTLILERHPDFAYVLRKWSGSRCRTIEVLRMWKRHREIEFPLALGYWNLAMSESFYKAMNSRQIVNFLLKENPPKEITLFEARTVLKFGLSLQELSDFKNFRSLAGNVSYPDYRYLKKIGIADYGGARLLKDYRSMLKRTEHDAEDAYWKFPKDLRARHDFIVEEIDLNRRNEDIRKIAEMSGDYLKKVRSLLKYNSVIDGYSVYVPETCEDWIVQAEVLHQCIVANGYMERVINGNCVIVFVRKEGKPVATAEVLNDGTLGQFYADELDRKDCLPSDEVRAVLEKWLKSFRKKRTA